MSNKMPSSKIPDFIMSIIVVLGAINFTEIFIFILLFIAMRKVYKMKLYTRIKNKLNI